MLITSWSEFSYVEATVKSEKLLATVLPLFFPLQLSTFVLSLEIYPCIAVR